MRFDNPNVYRVVLDTNVFVSGATISVGAPFQIINHWRGQDFVMVAFLQLIAEYKEVLSRPNVMKYTGLTSQENTWYMQEVKDRAYMTSGVLKLNVLTNDLDDNMILACAEEGIATHLVTGNTKDFPFKEYKGIQIVTPKEFLDILKE
ncbi:MAG: putative toxin-antitoxin system toxin component, PIN family [Patescibacteria group bacterium]